MHGARSTLTGMRIVVADCTVNYAGRLSAHLPRATRLILIKADGSLLVHAEAGAYKPLNWMNAPNHLVEEEGRWFVTNGKQEELTIDLHEVHLDTVVQLGEDPGLQKDGVELELQRLLENHLVDPLAELGAQQRLRGRQSALGAGQRRHDGRLEAVGRAHPARPGGIMAG